VSSIADQGIAYLFIGLVAPTHNEVTSPRIALAAARPAIFVNAVNQGAFYERSIILLSPQKRREN